MPIKESDLIAPVMRIVCRPQHAERGVSITELVPLLREVIYPDEMDLRYLKNRNDDAFTQKIRNLVSHRSLERRGLAVTDGRKRNRRLFPTEEGFLYTKFPHEQLHLSI